MINIASWNVNSINVRVEQVLQWLDKVTIDILALQETKCVDETFPLTPFIDAGFEVIVSGQKSYNGVAFISRDEGMDIITDMPQFVDEQRRILAATFNGIRVLNLYVPNGQAVGTEKYAYKLSWLEAIHDFVKEELKRFPKMVILGDFNIAPEDTDVHDPLLWKDKVLVSDKERAAFQALLDLGFKDSFRLFPQEKQQFSWWDYRTSGFRNNRGLRIDHLLLSEKMTTACQKSWIDSAPRTWERPSDHAPIIASFAFS